MSEEKDSPAPKSAENRLREKILSDCPRLGPEDTFKFSCQPGVSCFNLCCRDVNIFLSPYDVLRLRKRLGMESGEFLDEYALMPVQKDMRSPVLVLRMNDDQEKTCPFVTDEGCGVYSDRPWPCRMYPVGLAAPEQGSEEGQFFFLLAEDVCKGHEGDTEWSVAEWFSNQEMDEYTEFGELYKEVTLHPLLLKGKTMEPKQIDMFFTACYDLDKFRTFLFDSTFFEKFDVEPETIDRLKTDDVELLRFGFRWIKFCILQMGTLTIKGEVAKARQEELS